MRIVDLNPELLVSIPSKTQELSKTGKGKYFAFFGLLVLAELKLVRVGMIHRLDRGQHRDVSRVSSALTLESSGTRTRVYWLEYPRTKENIIKR